MGNPVCLVRGTLVQLNNHYLEIENIQDKERVLTHEGVYSTVEQRSVRDYSGPIYKLKNKLGSIEMTPDHLVLAVKRPEGHKYNYTRHKKKLKADWHHVNELDERDIALYPILKVTKDQEFFDLDFEKRKFDYRSFDLPEKVQVDADLLRLAGYYLAEGNAVTTATKAHICFTFHINEVEYQQDVVRIVKDKFGLEASIKKREDAHSANVIINSANLARVFELTFGKGAENKHIPDFMLFLPPEKQVHLLQGLWRGDGYINLERKGARAGYATISVQLAGQIKTLLLRQGIIPSMYSEPGSFMEEITHSEAYRVHVGDAASLEKLSRILGVKFTMPEHVKEHSWIQDGFLYTPITSIETRPFTGRVHNFEVAEQHSYVTDSFTIHNCGDLMYIYIKVKDDILTDVKFKTFGCGAAIATSSMVTDLAKGKTIQEALKITRKDVADNLGGLPPQKMHCSNLAADALHEAIHDYLRKQGREPPLPPGAKKPHEEDHCETDPDSPIHIEDSVPKK